MARHRKQPYVRRNDIRHAIVFLERMGKEVTMRNIASAIGMAPSTHLLNILRALADSRLVIIRQEPYRNSFRNLYELTDRGKYL